MKTQSPLTTLRELALVAAFALAVVSPLGAQNCPPFPNVDWSRTNVGFTPLNDLGSGFYQGQQGGLYPGGSTVRPPLHEETGVALARGIGPLDTNGVPDSNGSYVLLSIGISNTKFIFDTFKPLGDADTAKHPRLVIVNGADPGAGLDNVTPDSPYWNVVAQRLASAGVTSNQVSVVWIKMRAFRATFPTGAIQLQNALSNVVQILHDKFPNLRLAYFASRGYAGYSTDTKNPEPYSYESGFGVKWLIETQLNGDPALNFDPARGSVRAPWMAWGPYYWADGLVPRSDGLTWTCEDFIRSDGGDTDGIHYGDTGRAKIAGLLLNFFKTDTTAREWFLADWAITPVAIVQAGFNAASGEFNLTWVASPGGKYQVQHSPDLVTWTNVGLSLTAATDILTWVDDGTQTGTPPAEVTRRFYRVQPAP
ncbi:MAG: hypothetical protein L0Z50_31475 [Verrucomicrobiales bacterium]|nr:hypothetical protein [Verrucomicrobiales bacterium]